MVNQMWTNYQKYLEKNDNKDPDYKDLIFNFKGIK